MVHLSRQPIDVSASSASTLAQPRMRWGSGNDPRPWVGPFTWWPRLSDSVLAVAVFTASLIAAAASRVEDTEDFSFDDVGDLPVGAYAVLALASLSLCWRRRHSLLVAGIALATLWLWAMVSYGETPVLTMAVGLYSVGRYELRKRHTIAIIAAAFITAAITGAEDVWHQLELGGGLVFAILPWYIGRRVRNRGDYLAMLQDRATQLERERDAEALRAVADERSRIARELHDVVAHRVSMMTVQAGAAKTIARENIDAAVDAMNDVEKAGRQALGELRHLLGVLRPDGSNSDGLGPQPGIADIATLLAELAQAGTNVSLVIDPNLPEDLPAALDLSAYRIVQESLTNVVKHAGHNPNVDVRLTVEENRLEIEITNTTTHQNRSLPGAGYGIAGMGERAHLLGGTLDAGPRHGGRFSVSARLPLELEMP